MEYAIANKWTHTGGSLASSVLDWVTFILNSAGNYLTVLDYRRC
jgi:hypothetical protein